MMASSKQQQPPARHNKYYFLKVNIKDYWQVASLYHFWFSKKNEKIGGGGRGNLTPSPTLPPPRQNEHPSGRQDE